ncbi:hypothetical protein CsSME_00037774 [Camellia sinensis var. sinensis]
MACSSNRSSNGMRTCWVNNQVLIILFMLLSCAVVTLAAPPDDTEARKSLIKFKESLTNDSALNDWNESISLCSGNDSNWNGLLCLNDVFYGLRLESMGLKGMINMEVLAELPTLRSISVMNNDFEGPMPDIKKLGGIVGGSLRGLFLSNNRFSGEISDDAFVGMLSLRRVLLSHNEFIGKIPNSLAKLPKLADLLLDDNQFDGQLPDFASKDLRTVNLANNRFQGPIPPSLQDIFAGSFSGNVGLCGKPLKNKCKSSKKWSVLKMVIIIVVVGVVVLAAITVAFFICCGCRRRRRRRRRSHNKTTTLQFGKSAAKLNTKKEFADNNYKQKQEQLQEEEEEEEEENTDKKKKKKKKGGEQGQLHFVRNGRERFKVQDLLRASAQVLGSGNLGSSYKAILLSGPTVVVKKFRHMSSVGKDEFHRHMTRLGRLSHPNLLPLAAFYFKKEEKLLITDFVENGSLAYHLHGKCSPIQPGLDWPTRLKIIKGVAKGLAYLYKEIPSLTLPHGNLKSSNVLLDDTFEPLLGDYALVPVINKEHAQKFMVAYKSPEFSQHDRTTKKTDVWSLGILILEMLTGKFPANYLKQGKTGNADLAVWVNSVVREEWTGEVFDKDMKGTKNGEGEMLKLLKIGMCCCEWNVERRWDLREAIDKIEELKERDSDEDNSSYASEGNMYSSRAMTDEDFSFSVTG